MKDVLFAFMLCIVILAIVWIVASDSHTPSEPAPPRFVPVSAAPEGASLVRDDLTGHCFVVSGAANSNNRAVSVAPDIWCAR